MIGCLSTVHTVQLEGLNLLKTHRTSTKLKEAYPEAFPVLHDIRNVELSFQIHLTT